MAESIAYPFIRPPANSVDASPWKVSVDGADPVELGSGIGGWDYNSCLCLSRRVSFSLEGILRCCGLRQPCGLGIQVLLTTGTGSLRQRVYSRLVHSDADLPAQIEIRPDSATLQNDIMLRTELVLHVPGAADRHLAPREAGTRLWQDSVTASLEGSLSRFPVSAVDFGQEFPDSARAPWLLWWQPAALETNAAAAVRLYLNSARADMFSRLRDGDESLSGVLTADIVRQILVTLLHVEEFDADPAAWPEHSLGQVAAAWVNDFFPGQDAATVRTRLEQKPGSVEAEIHSAIAAGGN